MYTSKTCKLQEGELSLNDSHLRNVSLSQHLPFCGVLEETCIARALQKDHGCLAQCTGLYADVGYSEEDHKVPDKIDSRDEMLLNMLKDGRMDLDILPLILCLILLIFSFDYNSHAG